MSVSIYQHHEHLLPGVAVLVCDVLDIESFCNYFLPDIFHTDTMLLQNSLSLFFVKPHICIDNIHIYHFKINNLTCKICMTLALHFNGSDHH